MLDLNNIFTSSVEEKIVWIIEHELCLLLSLCIFPKWCRSQHINVLHFDVIIKLLFLSILVINIIDSYSILHLTFILHVFNLFIFYYEEANLPLYVKGWSGGVLSLIGPLGKVRFLCYGIYLIHHELMHVFIFFCRWIFLRT